MRPIGYALMNGLQLMCRAKPSVCGQTTPSQIIIVSPGNADAAETDARPGSVDGDAVCLDMKVVLMHKDRG
jgi:hypothetical protein